MAEKVVREISQMTYFGKVVGSVYIYSDGSRKYELNEEHADLLEIVTGNLSKYEETEVIVRNRENKEANNG